MSKQRVTPHRPVRETTTVKELAHSRREVNRLTREITRLRRELEKKGPPPEEETVPMAEATRATEKKVPACPCGNTEFLYYDTPGGKSLQICKKCKAKIVTATVSL